MCIVKKCNTSRHLLAYILLYVHAWPTGTKYAWLWKSGYSDDEIHFMRTVHTPSRIRINRTILQAEMCILVKGTYLYPNGNWDLFEGYRPSDSFCNFWECTYCNCVYLSKVHTTKFCFIFVRHTKLSSLQHNILSNISPKNLAFAICCHTTNREHFICTNLCHFYKNCSVLTKVSDVNFKLMKIYQNINWNGASLKE